MKRTPIKRKAALKSYSTLKNKEPPRPRKPMKSKPRKLTPLERKWQKAVLGLQYCVLCGRFGVQWAHRNEGKAAGKKVSPDQTAALCPPCHYEIDNGCHLTNRERRDLMDQAIASTHDRLRRCGDLPQTEDTP